MNQYTRVNDFNSEDKRAGRHVAQPSGFNYNLSIGDIISRIKGKINQRAVPDGKAGKAEALWLLKKIADGEALFEPERWFGVHGGAESTRESSIKEMLLRVWEQASANEPSVGSKIFKAINFLYENECYVDTDLMVFSLAVEQAKDYKLFPISINISPNSASSEEFWSAVLPTLTEIGTEKVVFELLEYPLFLPFDFELERMAELRRIGVTFALDDVDEQEDNLLRVKYYHSVCDYIKIDGKMIDGWIERGCRTDKDDALVQFLAKITEEYPKLSIIAEWVPEAEVAHCLSRLGVSLVQGKDIEERGFFSRLWDACYSGGFPREPCMDAHIS